LRPVSISSALPSDAGERGRLALHTLIDRCLQAGSPHALGAGADVRQVYLPDATSAVVNLNTAFADSHRSGVQVEQLSIFSMVLTLKAQLPTVTRVRFLVDGKLGPSYEEILVMSSAACRFVDVRTVRFYGIKAGQVYRITLDLGA
jgi:hypothetical protein